MSKINQMIDEIAKVTGVRSTWFRPPYGVSFHIFLPFSCPFLHTIRSLQ
jgi:peptidoglycan/xylan/chitin deacetylase (PgdA/CDA1 family)